MDADAEIKELLREIRDLQKAHYERYQQFTQAVLDNTAQANSKFEQELIRAVRASRQATRSNVAVVVTILFTFLFWWFRR